MASVDIEFVEEDIPDTEGTEEASGSREGEATGADAAAAAEDKSEPRGKEDGAGDCSPGEETSEEQDAASGAEKADKGEEAGAKERTVPDKKDQQIAELNDRYLRLFAEFDNFRKRSETEKAGRFADGERTVLLRVLPLIDNFERALGTVPEDQKESAFVTGMEKVYRAFTDQLKELGVTAIEAVGHEFDANYHNAVMHVEDEAQPENVVVEEFQKGYMFREKVLRYSMVKVAN